MQHLLANNKKSANCVPASQKLKIGILNVNENKKLVKDKKNSNKSSLFIYLFIL